jgi:hypothetical protein
MQTSSAFIKKIQKLKHELVIQQIPNLKDITDWT